ncbi:MAG TPA: Bpu10I family restriction endonuclease, partial [Acidimicrobiales bacterium]
DRSELGAILAEGASDELEAVIETAEQGPVTASSLFGDLPLTNAHPHGSNILKKARDATKEKDKGKQDLIREISARYVEWRREAESTECPSAEEPDEFVSTQTALYSDYRDLLDDDRVDVFDSRGALQPSALEEFCYFLLRPLVRDIEHKLALGHREIFQGLYFTAPNFARFADLPLPNYPVGNLDFVIGKQVTSTLSTEDGKVETSIFVPAVAIECKTYLDRPRWIESDILAANIKRGFPGCLYILLSEFLKLDLAKVNVLGSQIDRVYVLRRAKNVDRKIRREGGEGLKPIHVPAAVDLFARVRDHLNNDWVSPESWEDSGILK